MRWYFGFFLVSGFCSLTYEVVWLRLVMAEFGVTTPSVSILLSVFMAGLALGSWGAGRLARGFESHAASSPLRFYALAELLIAISGVTIPRQLTWGRGLLEGIGGEVAWGSSAYYLMSGLWITLTLLPFCTCMGATFPLAMSAIRKRYGAEAQRSFSYLYLANVLGATSGTVISAFILVEVLGFQGTLLLTAILNGILAASAFAVSLAPTSSAIRTVTTSGSGLLPTSSDSPRTAILGCLFATGLISMAMEVVWIRQFTPYLHTTVYAFAAILVWYLAATSVGSGAYRVWGRSGAARENGVVWIAAGLLGLLPLLSADPRLPLQSDFAQVVRVVVGVIPFCGVVGFLTPMLVDRWSSGSPARAGTAYAINVVGSILGPLLAGFWLLPWLGDRWALFTLTLPLFAIGVLAMFRSDPRTVGRHRAWTARLLAAVGILLSLLLVGVTRGYEELFSHREVRRDYTATVIATGEGMRKQLLINGYGTTSLTPITKMMAHLPLAFLATPPQNSLVVGFGMGTTFRSLLSWGIPATAVELVPSVPSLFGYYHPDGPELLRSPLARIVIDDGRRFLKRSPARYDVITVDPPPPIEAAGSSLLYSREFYSIVKRRLRPEGILQQWYPGGDLAVLSSVAQALRDSFPYVRVFRSIEGWGVHFLASVKPIPLTHASVLAGRLPPDAVADLLEWGPSRTAEHQFKAVLGWELPLELIIEAAPGVPALEDDRPINEYFFLRRMFHSFAVRRLTGRFFSASCG